MEIKEQQSKLTSYVARLLRTSFGKGPEAVFSAIGDGVITIYLRDFSTAVEKVLIENHQFVTLYETRNTLMKKLIPELQQFIQTEIGENYQEFYYSWNIESTSGVIVAADTARLREQPEYYPEQKEINHLVSKVTEKAERLPDSVSSVKLNNRTIVIYRQGILVNIEKEIVRIEEAEVLRQAKSNLEKRYLREALEAHGHLLDGTIRELFVDWDFDRDNSMIVVVIDPKNK